MPTFTPESVCVDILLRLPLKSILRFRCLSTSFGTEIDGSDSVTKLIEMKAILDSIIANEISRFRQIFQLQILTPANLNESSYSTTD
ncbi:hypothetical protein SLA2020_486630 [Shorea laevis]